MRNLKLVIVESMKDIFTLFAWVLAVSVTDWNEARLRNDLYCVEWDVKL